mmetsp:Transcript_33965/g.82770  ORF Transcript_33965/g.82770 Transcript_33965/m.82770 type:complete len:104 (-) Transcript_33965:1764-2075(-)
MIEMGKPSTKIPLRPATHATNSPQAVFGVMSPYPIVVTDIMEKYMLREMEVNSVGAWPSSGNSTYSQKYIPEEIITTAMNSKTPRMESSITQVLKVVASTRTP